MPWLPPPWLGVQNTGDGPAIADASSLAGSDNKATAISNALAVGKGWVQPDASAIAIGKDATAVATSVGDGPANKGGAVARAYGEDSSIATSTVSIDEQLPGEGEQLQGRCWSHPRRGRGRAAHGGQASHAGHPARLQATSTGNNSVSSTTESRSGGGGVVARSFGSG
jgi:hypothetical protein